MNSDSGYLPSYLIINYPAKITQNIENSALSEIFFKNFPKYLELIENASIFAAPFLIRINLTFVFGLGL